MRGVAPIYWDFADFLDHGLCGLAESELKMFTATYDKITKT